MFIKRHIISFEGFHISAFSIPINADIFRACQMNNTLTALFNKVFGCFECSYIIINYYGIHIQIILHAIEENERDSSFQSVFKVIEIGGFFGVGNKNAIYLSF